MQKKVQKCEKVPNANAMRKWSQNSHRTTVTKFFRIFSHRIRIALPSLWKTFANDNSPLFALLCHFSLQ
jgi:hypothetical protein